MVLAVVVVILCLRVYEVMRPKQPPPPPNYTYPRTQLPEDPQELADLGFPGAPPLPPIPAAAKVWSSLWKRNAFWYNPSVTSTGDEKLQQFLRNPGVRLLNITAGKGGKYRAQLQTSSSRKWYDEGEQFEQFELVSIDPEKQECVVYSIEFQQPVPLKKE